MTSAHPGSRNCYQHGCSQPQCIAANSRYCKEYELRTGSRSHRLLIDAGPSRAVLQRYRDAGWSPRRIALACDISRTSVLRILAGRPTIYQSTVERIATTRPTAALRPLVPSLGSVRRLRALVARRHSIAVITTASGVASSTIRALLHHPSDMIYVSTADGVDRAYAALSGCLGDSTRSQHAAERNGWLHLLSWTVEDLDAPEPESANRREALARDRAADVQHLASFGIGAEEIAARVGLSLKYVRNQLDGTRGPGWRERVSA